MSALQGADAVIGPNAVLQVMAVLDRELGRAMRDRVLAGLRLPAPDSGMIPEGDAVAVHRALRTAMPDRADAVLVAAGVATADYILRHRIPLPARLLIRALPSAVGARLLARAIERHAWTFAGSGRFRLAGLSPVRFELAANPLVAEGHACLWHQAVFQRLFSRLVWPDCAVREVACAGMGSEVCNFVILPRG